jgi:hypothetical protein
MSKKKVCWSFYKNNSCKFGDSCKFAHSMEELNQGMEICKFPYMCKDLYGKRSCCRRHQLEWFENGCYYSRLETAEEVIFRLGLLKPFPYSVNKNFETEKVLNMLNNHVKTLQLRQKIQDEAIENLQAKLFELDQELIK